MSVPAAMLRGHVERLIAAAHDAPGGVTPIVQAGHPVLRMVAEPYDGQLDDVDLEALIALMHRTMRAAPGVGLAAPQIGLPLAIAVVEDPGTVDPETAAARERTPVDFRVLVNPRYTAVGERTAAFYEGCLSVVGYQAVVARPRQVRLTGTDETGRALDELVTGWAARIVQHETDHLGGTLYLDRAVLRSLSATDDLGGSWAAEPHPVAAARSLGFDLATGDLPG